MNINGGIYVGVDRRGVFCLEVREGENELGQALCDEVERSAVERIWHV